MNNVNKKRKFDMEINRKTLYDLPKDILVELLMTVKEKTEKDLLDDIFKKHYNRINCMLDLKKGRGQISKELYEKCMIFVNNMIWKLHHKIIKIEPNVQNYVELHISMKQKYRLYLDKIEYVLEDKVKKVLKYSDLM